MGLVGSEVESIENLSGQKRSAYRLGNMSNPDWDKCQLGGGRGVKYSGNVFVNLTKSIIALKFVLGLVTIDVVSMENAPGKVKRANKMVNMSNLNRDGCDLGGG